MKEAAMDHSREKKFDGRYNTDDGTHILPGYTGRGINKFISTKKHKKDDVEDQHEGEMANVKKEFEDRETIAKNKEIAARKAFEESERKRRWNEFDGSIHKDDGSRVLPDGSTVAGVNTALKLKNHHHKKHSHVQTHVKRDDEDNFKEAEDRE